MHRRPTELVEGLLRLVRPPAGPTPQPGPEAAQLALVAELDRASLSGAVRALRSAHPTAPSRQLASRLIRQKCRQTVLTILLIDRTSRLPLVGGLAMLVTGAEDAATAALRLQAELVYQLAELYGYQLSAEEHHKLVFATAALAQRPARLLSRPAASSAGGPWAQRLRPLAGALASLGSQLLATYLVGRRAHSYVERRARRRPSRSSGF